MKLKTKIRELNFEKINLIQSKTNLSNVFRNYKNKSLRQTLEKIRYHSLQKIFKTELDSNLSLPLGDYLLKLKNKKNKNYMKFLNKYGDKTYSEFKISDERILNCKGIYFYSLNNKIKYIGITKDNFKKRVNNGYGKIHPKNCFKDGQSTNCHLNWLISSSFSKIEFYVHLLEDLNEINNLEKELILSYTPSWNIQLKN